MDVKKQEVCVLIATYNGEKYIKEQIDSILGQRDVTVKIIVRDDGSTDSTLEILREYEDSGYLTLKNGTNLGPALNFLRMTQEAPDFEYYAWSDQDDVWDEDKLIIGINRISGLDDRPALYYSASRTVDAKGKEIDVIGSTNPSLTFEQALIQSKAQGATFVFNKQLQEAIKDYTPEFKKNGLLHDAWVHRVCLAIGGTVVHDPNPHMSYRIHESNVVAKLPTRSIIERLKLAMSINSIHYCSNVAKELINGYKNKMSVSNLRLAETMAYYRHNINYKFILLVGKRIRIESKKELFKFKWNVLFNRI